MLKFNDMVRHNVIPTLDRDLYIKSIYDGTHLPLSDSFINTLYSKNYNILGVIGSGSISTVYLIEDTKESEYSHRKYLALVVLFEARCLHHMMEIPLRLCSELNKLTRPYVDRYDTIMNLQSQHRLYNTAILYDYFQVDEIVRPNILEIERNRIIDEQDYDPYGDGEFYVQVLELLTPLSTYKWIKKY